MAVALEIDAFEFCRREESREGNIAVSDLPRLAESTVDRSGTVHWSLRGSADALGHPKLELTVSGTVKLTCQRCLAPFDVDIASESVLILAQDEESVEEIDELLADETADVTVDVIAGSQAQKIEELIEDEVLLSLPLSPKHPVCQGALENTTKEKLSPFAVLKNLKQQQ